MGCGASAAFKVRGLQHARPLKSQLPRLCLPLMETVCKTCKQQAAQASKSVGGCATAGQAAAVPKPKLTLPQVRAARIGLTDGRLHAADAPAPACASCNAWCRNFRFSDCRVRNCALPCHLCTLL